MDHNLEVRSILSHAMLGSNDNLDNKTFNLCVSETVRYIEKQLAESHIGNVIGSAFDEEIEKAKKCEMCSDEAIRCVEHHLNQIKSAISHQ